MRTRSSGIPGYNRRITGARRRRLRRRLLERTRWLPRERRRARALPGGRARGPARHVPRPDPDAGEAPRARLVPAVVAWTFLVFVVAAGLGGVALGVESYLKFRTFNGYCIWPRRMEVSFTPQSEVMPGVSGTVRFSTNKHGIRARGLSWRDDYRILAIGGSTTECTFLDDSETWTRLLEDMLNRRLAGRRVWVGNAGRSGLNTANHVEAMEKLVPQLPSIDAVVFLVGINNLSLRLSRGMRPRGRGKTPTRATSHRKRSFLVVPRAESPLYHLSRLRTRLDVLRRSIGGCPRPRQENRNTLDAEGVVYRKWRDHRRAAKSIINTVPDVGYALEGYASDINKLVDLARAQGVRPVFATQPTMWHQGIAAHLDSLLWFGGIGDFQKRPGSRYYSVAVLERLMNQYNKTLKNVCENRQVECIDLAGVLPKDTTVFYDDCHFNENGARFVARAISARFLSSDPLAEHRRE